jgi:hypothetical protein
MTYFEQLHPWCIICNSPKDDGMIVARFRRRNDATAYLQVLQRQMNSDKFVLKFNAQI